MDDTTSAIATHTRCVDDPANGGDDHLPGLLPHHLRELRASRLSDETIRAAGLHSECNYAKLAVLLEWKLPKKCFPALVIPYHGLDGNNGYARVKPDNPRVSEGKPIKYEAPKGRTSQPYFPPGVAEIASDASQRLLITEGEKKSLKATQEGFPCIGLSGVFSWKDAKTESLLPALEQIAWQGRDVLIVFDSDFAHNANVQEAEARLAVQLSNRGAKVRAVRLPDGLANKDGIPKMGLDDFLVAHGAVELEKLINAATSPEKPTAPVAKINAEQADPAREAASFLESNKSDGVNRLRFWRGSFWLWVNGCYRPIPTSEARAELVNFLNHHLYGVKMQHSNNALDQVKAKSILSSSVEPPAWLNESVAGWEPDKLIVCRNGIVNLENLTSGGGQPSDHMRPATPKLFVTSAVDYDFRPDAPQPTAWLEFLRQLWPDDPESIALLREWFGYSLTADTSQQKLLMLIGPKRSGKGTIARVLTRLVGAANVAGPTLASFSTNFGLWPLLGKSLAIVSDARLSGRADQAAITERLLSISGEDSLTIDRKNLEPVTCKLWARVILISNELPRLSDTSGALASRMILLRLDNSFYGREDHALTNKLLDELPGILLWAIGGWQSLRRRGRFVQPKSGEELLGELSDLTSPVGQFVAEWCIVGPQYRAAMSDLYDAWRRWCESVGRREPGTEQTYGRDLRAAVPGLKQVNLRAEYGGRYRAYDGIGLVSGSSG